ncbi:Uma2 family endonuclease [Azospirillum sp. SYSU D00513]|uniref:Uma2 family endonuclease n=1 Tax=Azospirillum sp. SYSU D00513 TaxID=2812561 RepID=UPI001A9604E5|nr:Uma2 family endonuclease [Azospirillum sp. SYSU D00513]
MGEAARKRPVTTVEEFLELEFGDDRRYELIDGEVVAQASPSPEHGTIQSALDRHIGNALDARNKRDGMRCRSLTEAGIPTPLDPKHNWRQADIAATCEPHVPGSRFTTAPTLLVEILSPEDEAKQRAKLHVYGALPSVREILFVDSRCIRAEIHRRQPDGTWPLEPEIVVGDEPLRLESCGLEVPLSACSPFLDLPVGER